MYFCPKIAIAMATAEKFWLNIVKKNQHLDW